LYEKKRALAEVRRCAAGGLVFQGNGEPASTVCSAADALATAKILLIEDNNPDAGGGVCDLDLDWHDSLVGLEAEIAAGPELAVGGLFSLARDNAVRRRPTAQIGIDVRRRDEISAAYLDSSA